MTAQRGASPRTLEISSPAIPVVLGRPALEAIHLSGHEGVNSLFEYELLLRTPGSLNAAFTDAANFDLCARTATSPTARAPRAAPPRCRRVLA